MVLPWYHFAPCKTSLCGARKCKSPLPLREAFRSQRGRGPSTDLGWRRWRVASDAWRVERPGLSGGLAFPIVLGRNFPNGGDGDTGLETPRVRRRLDNISQIARTKPNLLGRSEFRNVLRALKLHRKL